MHARKHINYADLNTGIDSEPDYSPPCKKKHDIVVALREPSQTVISAHWQHITDKDWGKCSQAQNIKH